MELTKIKKILQSLDRLFKTDLYKNATSLVQFYYNCGFLNKLRCKWNFILLRSGYKLRTNKEFKPLKLHLGCGDQAIKGYVNIDHRKTFATNLVCDIKKLPYIDNSVQLIEIYHVIEHLSRHDLPKALKEWNRVLIKGGRLIIECPNFDVSVKEYLDGNEKKLDNIFGLQRFLGDVHQFGYNFKRLEEILISAGFVDIKQKEPQDYHKDTEPCLRIECVKR